jgi:hypothetical protein
MNRQIRPAFRDYVLAGLVIMPGLIVSCVLLSGYLLKLSDRCEDMHITLPMHLLLIIKWYLSLPWSALLTAVPFVLFEVAAPTERKNEIRQGVLVILALIVVSINALTAWSVVDIQDRLLRTSANHNHTIGEPGGAASPHSPDRPKTN